MFFDIRMHEKYTEQTLQFSAELKVEIPTELPSDYLLQSARKLSAIATDGDVLICNKVFYECGFENPYPEKTPQSFVYQPREGKENITVTLEKIVFE